jgi:lysophospholipase L1-like esterase
MMPLSRRSFLLQTAAAALVPAGRAEGPATFFPRAGERIVFLGDSITQAGQYVEYIEAYLLTRFPERQYDVIKLGLSSETVSGLTERDHPFPRPNLHDRLDSALEKTRPDIVTACYGINDGIYHPFDMARFAAYRAGIRKLVEKVRKAGARLVLLAPPPFDPLAKPNVVVGANAPEFGYKTPFRDYDRVVARYGEWVLALRGDGVQTVDLHSPFLDYVRERRKERPGFLLTGDGIHPGPVGHALMALAILRAWNAPAEVGRGHVPMPMDPRWKDEALALRQLTRHLNRFTLASGGEGRYRVFEGDVAVGEGAGPAVNLLPFEKLTANVRAAEVLRAVQERWRVLGPAWLKEVGHKRADLMKLPPFAESSAQGKALLERARAAAQPVEMRLRAVKLA